MKYEVTYLTVNGWYSLPYRTRKEAEVGANKLRELNKQPGNMALGIKVVTL